MGTPALIGLGSNLGDRRAHLDAAVAALAATPGLAVVAVSRYHGTDPVGGPPGQGAFLNAAALLECSLDPVALHARLQAIEADQGRTREVRWGARTLDLDLLLFGNQIIDTPTLTVPHLRMAVRRFVLAPAVEIAPTLVDPLTARTVADLLANLDRRPSVVVLSRSVREFDPGLPARLGAMDHETPAKPTLFRLLLDRIGAGGGMSYLNVNATLNFHYESECNFSSRSERPVALIELEQKARELQRNRWSQYVWGDRWLLFDYWLPEALRRACNLFPEGLPLRSEVEDEFRDALCPTFVVMAGDDAERPLAPAPAPARMLPQCPLMAPPINEFYSPILRVRGTAIPEPPPPGSPRFDEEIDPWQGQFEGWMEASRAKIVEEVAAACAASRGG